MGKCRHYKIEHLMIPDKQKWPTLGQVSPQHLSIPCCEHKDYPARKDEIGAVPECNGEIGKDNKCPFLKYNK